MIVEVYTGDTFEAIVESPQELCVEVYMESPIVETTQQTKSLTIIANIAVGRNVVSHDLGSPARMVQFWQGEAPINFYFTRLDAELNNDPNKTIVIESEDSYENVEIDIIAY